MLSYYANQVLGPLYEAELKEVNGLSDAILAYRKIPANKYRNKCNVHFAKDVFDFIKSKNECIAMVFDISSFFDSLNHKHLKQMWSSLLRSTSLPKDHYNIYKSITRFKYVSMGNYKKVPGILQQFNIRHTNEFKRKKVAYFCSDINEFKEKIVNARLIRSNPHSSDGALCGIPQGTPISAFLANLYLLEFDNFLHNEVTIKGAGLYKRYSDDIIIVCSVSQQNEFKKMILDQIKKCHLSIQPEKVCTVLFKDKSSFELTSNGEYKANIPLRYLGFEFNGKQILLKSASIAKFYRNMKKLIRIKARKARNAKHQNHKSKGIYKYIIYKRFSYLGKGCEKRNYISYVLDAAEIMQDDSIRKQISSSWKKLQAEIKKHETPFKYTNHANLPDK